MYIDSKRPAALVSPFSFTFPLLLLLLYENVKNVLLATTGSSFVIGSEAVWFGRKEKNGYALRCPRGGCDVRDVSHNMEGSQVSRERGM